MQRTHAPTQGVARRALAGKYANTDDRTWALIVQISHQTHAVLNRSICFLSVIIYFSRNHKSPLLIITYCAGHSHLAISLIMQFLYMYVSVSSFLIENQNSKKCCFKIESLSMCQSSTIEHEFASINTQAA